MTPKAQLCEPDEYTIRNAFWQSFKNQENID